MFRMISQHKIIVIVSIVVIVGIAWYSLSSSGGSAPTGLLTSTAPGDSGDQELLRSLQTLRGISIDTTIFTNPAYLSLKDFSTQIIPEPVGRPDPFAPLPNSVAPTANTTKSAQIFKSVH